MKNEKCIETSRDEYNTVRERLINVVRCNIPGIPRGKARARTFYNKNMGKMQSITPKTTVNYENLVKLCYRAQQNKYFTESPLEIVITAHFEIPKSTSKKDRELIKKNQLYPTKKPDADNIAKIICDALNGVAYNDDKQIVKLTVKKDYAEIPSVDVEIREIR